MVSPSLSFLNLVFKTHNLNSKPITHNSKPTITQKIQNFCLLTKLSHISQLLSPPFAKMVEPPDQSFSTAFFPYPCDSTWITWNPHPNPVSSPPPTTNLDSTTINTTNSHTKNPKECTGNPQPNPTSPKKKKNNAEQKKRNRSQKMEIRPKTMKRLRSTSWCRRWSFRSRGPRVSQSHLGSVRRCFLNPLFSSPTWRSGFALSLMPHKKSKRKTKWRVWADWRPKSRAWIRILKLET